MFGGPTLLMCLVVAWAGQKSVNGDPAAAADPKIDTHRPVWYNSPFSPSLVYQRSPAAASSANHGESRAFLSPVYYAPAVTRSAGSSGSASSSSSTTTTTEAAPSVSPKKYDILKFFEKLKYVNEKYAKPSPTVGTPKQLNEDAEEDEEEKQTATVGAIGNDRVVESDERPDRAESEEDDGVVEAINEGRKKFHSHGLIKFKTKGKKKLSKLVYAIVVGLITAKSIIIPLFFKAVVVLSKFSFFVSTLSFIISSILGIKVLLLSNNNNRRSNDNTRVEVVHVPLQQKYPTTYSSSSSHGWIDRESESKFIPITGNEGERIIYEKPYAEQQKDLEKDSYLPL